MDAVPPSMLRSDPWLLLARARTLRAQGRFRDAAETYLAAELAFGDTEGAQTAAAERSPLVPWLDPDPPRAHTGGTSQASPSVALRMATVRDPALIAARPAPEHEPARALVVALALFLAGESDRAREALRTLIAGHDDEGLTTIAASLASGAARATPGPATRHR